MKICLINNLFTPDKKGGVETIVEIIAQGLRKQGHNVFVVCAGQEQNKTTEEEQNKIKVYRIGWHKYFAFQNIEQQNIFFRLLYRIYQLNNNYSARVIRAILKREKPNLILSHNTLALGYNIIREINKSNIKHINTIHDVQLIIPSGKLEANRSITKLEKIYGFFTRNIYKHCKYIVSPSQALLDFYTSRGFFANAKTEIISNPVLPLKPISNNKKNNSSKLNLLYLGQLEYHKGIMNLLKAFRLLNHDKFFLTVAGRGSLTRKIKNYENILSNFKFFGEYNSKQRAELLNKHDLIILPSLCFENSPMVILEAWQAGVPVLASNFGGIVELIETKKTGWLFNSQNIKSLKDKLQEIEKNREQLKQMSKNCLKKVKEFTLEKYLDKLLSL